MADIMLTNTVHKAIWWQQKNTFIHYFLNAQFFLVV